MKGIYLRSVYFLGFTSGGSVTHTSGVVNSMAKQIDLEVISNDKLVGVNVPIRLIPAFLKHIPVVNELLYNLWLIRLLKNDIEADFIYQRYSGESFCGARLSKLHDIPFVLEFNSSEVWKLSNWSQTKNPLKNFLKTYIQLPITQRVEAYNLKQASLIIVVSESLKENLVADGVDSNKILINPNGVDLDRFKHTEGEKWRDKLNIKNKFVYGFIGSFGKWHGVLELAKAIVQYFDNFPERLNHVSFLIIGNGKLYDDFQRIIYASNYAGSVVCTGDVPQHEGPNLLSCCDVFLSPHIANPDGTKFFGSPTKLFEYMACGKAIIASDLDQIGELLSHSETGYMIKPGNVQDLTSAMDALYKNEELRLKLGKNALNLVTSKYSWDSHVTHILQAINKLKSN